MHVESFASVHQLVSTVIGTLTSNHDALSAVVAAFPPGSMTGAPKCRTMRIIDELELSTPRGPYSGCLGFFSVSGTCDLNVIIRTAVLDEHSVSVGAGGAIVALSDASDEYEEVLLKARQPMRAVAQCVTGDPDAYVVGDGCDDDRAADGPTVGATRLEQPSSVRASLLQPPYSTQANAQGTPAMRSAPQELFETILHTSAGGFFLLDGHLDRLCGAAASLCYARHLSQQDLRSRLSASLGEAAGTWPPSESSRVRLSLGHGGKIRIDRAPFSSDGSSFTLPAPAGGGPDSTRVMRRIVLDTRPTASLEPSLRIKSASRHVYDEARRRAGCVAVQSATAVARDAPSGAPSGGVRGERAGPVKPPPPFDVLLYNEAGEVTECALANIALQDADVADRWSTPPLDCGLLPGVMRRELLGSERLHERPIYVDELRAALRAGRRLVAFNALRGVYEVELTFGSAHTHAPQRPVAQPRAC